MTTETTPAEPAVSAIQTAIAERQRLDALRAQLTGRRPELEAARVAAVADADRAEAEILLAVDDRAATKVADAARKRAQAAEAELARIDGALRALPAKLAEADQALDAAGMAFEQLYGDRVTAALQAYERDVAVAAGQLAEVLRRGHALRAAAAGLLRDHLEEVRVPALRYGESNFIRGSVALIAGEVVRLDEAWLQDESAMSIFADLQPLRRLADQLSGHRDRISREKEDQRIEENRRNRERAFTPGNNPPLERRDPSTEAWTAPAGVGPLRGYQVRTPGTPIPQPGGEERPR